MSTTDVKTTSPPVDISPDQLAQWLDADEAVLIDVRDDFERAAERIPAAHHAPLSKLDCEALQRAHPGKRIVFHCRTGRRSLDAAGRYQSVSDAAYHLAGGIEAWKASGRPVERSPGAPRIDVMRQVQITAGSLVLLGVLLGLLVWPWFLALSAFVGAGLVFAGASGWCGMAKLLALMPWNRSTTPPGVGP